MEAGTLFASTAFVAGVAVGAIGLAAVVFGRIPPRLLSTRALKVTYHSSIGERRFDVKVSRAALQASPVWQLGAPVPLSPEDALAKALTSAQALPSPKGGWSLDEIALRHERPDESYYVIRFRTEGKSIKQDYLQLIVYLTGEVSAPGIERRDP